MTDGELLLTSKLPCPVYSKEVSVILNFLRFSKVDKLTFPGTNLLTPEEKGANLTSTLSFAFGLKAVESAVGLGPYLRNDKKFVQLSVTAIEEVEKVRSHCTHKFCPPRFDVS